MIRPRLVYLDFSARPQVALQFDHGVHSVKIIGWGQRTGPFEFPAQIPVSA